MSYDLMVFDPKAALQSRSEFMDWYRQQTKWQEGHRYDDPAVSASALRSWFLDMITSYPMMNGPYATENLRSRTTVNLAPADLKKWELGVRQEWH